nr:MAG TPA: hypothetical protein [Caudoviricetes sp.]
MLVAWLNLIYGRWYPNPSLFLYKKRPRLMPRTVQTLLIILYHKGM